MFATSWTDAFKWMVEAIKLKQNNAEMSGKDIQMTGAVKKNSDEVEYRKRETDKHKYIWVLAWHLHFIMDKQVLSL